MCAVGGDSWRQGNDGHKELRLDGLSPTKWCSFWGRLIAEKAMLIQFNSVEVGGCWVESVRDMVLRGGQAGRFHTDHRRKKGERRFSEGAWVG